MQERANREGRKVWEGKLTSDRTYGLPANVICNYNQIPLIPLQVSADVSSLRKADPKGRSALLADIQQGTRLRKVTQINDRSAPQIEGKWASGLLRAKGRPCEAQPDTPGLLRTGPQVLIRTHIWPSQTCSVYSLQGWENQSYLSWSADDV